MSLTRCRDVVKPKGFVPGMVRLTGTVGTVSVELGREKKRLDCVRENEGETERQRERQHTY